MRFMLEEQGQGPQVVCRVRVSRDEPVVVESLPLFDDLAVESVTFVVALEGEDMPHPSTLMSLMEAWCSRAATLALAAVRDAGWPQGRYLADVAGDCARAQYVAEVVFGEPVRVRPQPPF